MSELQHSLLLAGIVIILAVLIINQLQLWRVRRGTRSAARRVSHPKRTENNKFDPHDPRLQEPTLVDPQAGFHAFARQESIFHEPTLEVPFATAAMLAQDDRLEPCGENVFCERDDREDSVSPSVSPHSGLNASGAPAAVVTAPRAPIRRMTPITSITPTSLPAAIGETEPTILAQVKEETTSIKMGPVTESVQALELTKAIKTVEIDALIKAQFPITGLQQEDGEDLQPKESAERIEEGRKESLEVKAEEQQQDSGMRKQTHGLEDDKYDNFDKASSSDAHSESLYLENNRLASNRGAHHVTAVIDPLIDCVIAVPLDYPILGERLLPLLSHLRHVGNKTVYCEALNLSVEQREPIRAGQRYRDICVAVQLANRHGPLHPLEFSEFSLGVQQLAQALESEVSLPDAAIVLAAARELDVFAQENDIQLNIHVQSPTKSLTATDVYAVLVRDGLVLSRDGSYFTYYQTIDEIEAVEPVENKTRVGLLDKYKTTPVSQPIAVADGEQAHLSVASFNQSSQIEPAEQARQVVSSIQVFASVPQSIPISSASALRKAAKQVFTLRFDDCHFLRDNLAHYVGDQLTLRFEAPCSLEAIRPFHLMWLYAQHLAKIFGAEIVDDRGHRLAENAVLAIEKRLDEIYTRLRQRGIAAGSSTALRLFSA